MRVNNDICIDSKNTDFDTDRYPILIFFCDNLDSSSHFRQLAKVHCTLTNTSLGISPNGESPIDEHPATLKYLLKDLCYLKGSRKTQYTLVNILKCKYSAKYLMAVMLKVPVVSVQVVFLTSTWSSTCSSPRAALMINICLLRSSSTGTNICTF